MFDFVFDLQNNEIYENIIYSRKAEDAVDVHTFWQGFHLSHTLIILKRVHKKGTCMYSCLQYSDRQIEKKV